MKDDLDRKTVIIPITKKDNKYILEVQDVLWNQMQVYILEGGIRKNTTIEFYIKAI